jgi:hypothetical protein
VRLIQNVTCFFEKEKKEEEEEVLASVIYSKGQLRFLKESWKCDVAINLR